MPERQQDVLESSALKSDTDTSMVVVGTQVAPAQESLSLINAIISRTNHPIFSPLKVKPTLNTEVS
jgi:hypothetical protein